MKITQIYLDMDDVCNAFSMFALKKVGCPVEPFDFHLFKPEWGFDILRSVNLLHPRALTHNFPSEEAFYFTGEYFWSLIDRSVWRDAPESKEFKWLLSECEALVGRENVCILTTPTEDPECLAGKLEWIHDHFPKWMHKQYLIGWQKHLLARPGALLIDDSDKNVDAFQKAGGQTLLVPRPWNSMHMLNTERELHAFFHRLQCNRDLS